MFRIVEAEFLAPDIKRFVIEAPRIARKRQPGQFVIVRIHLHGERIPLTIAYGDHGHGTITLIVQGIGKTTKLMNSLSGGDAILDVVRTACRLGARNSYLIYRRSEKEMPARAEEARHAKDEGIQFLCLTNPVAFHGDEQGWLRGVRCIKMELGEPDESSRRSPVAVPGSEFELPIQMAVIALGTNANPLVQSSTPDLQTNCKGYIAADPQTLQTSRRGVFAAGDIVTGAATVILAMAAGRKAAHSIQEYLRQLR
jgi:glutamate synthase (NADPH/NADH) small chain